AKLPESQHLFYDPKDGLHGRFAPAVKIFAFGRLQSPLHVLERRWIVRRRAGRQIWRQLAVPRSQLIALCLEALALTLVPSMEISPSSAIPISAAKSRIWVNRAPIGSRNRRRKVQIVSWSGRGVPATYRVGTDS